MIVVTNASPLIALSQANVLPILGALFGRVLMPDTVYQETVSGCTVPIQKQSIEAGIGNYIEVVAPATRNRFSRNLGQGECGVLDLALERRADLLLMDDRKARGEAKSLGLTCALTTDILRYAEQRGLLDYRSVVDRLRHHRIYLP
jgi:predicted nucleic acid-binding protein